MPFPLVPYYPRQKAAHFYSLFRTFSAAGDDES